jgi:hypothetical protein
LLGDPGAPSGAGDEWALWQRRVFGDPYLVWHDGPDFTALLEAARVDRDAVARMLAIGIERGDPLAAESFGWLARAGFARDGWSALLSAAVSTATGTLQVRLAEALHVLTLDESWGNVVASVLTTGGFWGERIDAAIALAGFAPTEELVAALARAVCDDEYLVRYHAANTLLRYAGRAGDIARRPALFAKIKTPASGAAQAADRLAWQSAADQLAGDVRR